jgi:hypothetical protein
VGAEDANILSLFLCLFFLWQYWDLNSGPCACWAGTLLFEPHQHLQLFFHLIIFQVGLGVFAQSQP